MGDIAIGLKFLVIMKYRKSDSGSTRLVSFRIETDVYDNLKRYNVNLNAQVNHYLSNLSMHLDLYDRANSKEHFPLFVYTK